MRILGTFIAAAVLALPPVVVGAIASPAHAASLGKYYSSCDKLHKDYKHGVAKSTKAANRAVRDGYGRPSTTKKAKGVYATNHNRPSVRVPQGSAWSWWTRHRSRPADPRTLSGFDEVALAKHVGSSVGKGSVTTGLPGLGGTCPAGSLCADDSGAGAGGRT